MVKVMSVVILTTDSIIEYKDLYGPNDLVFIRKVMMGWKKQSKNKQTK